MEKGTMIKVTIVMIVAMAIALLIRGIVLHSKGARDAQVDVEEMPFVETELEEKPYSGCIVVVDAGHGGKDPGKVGINGTLEKDINLEIAMLLKEVLEEEGITVVMTRQSDMGLYDESSSNKKMQDMKARLSMIEDCKPDLVVSIHQNSFGDASVCGPQVFYHESSEKGGQAAKLMQDALNEELEIARPRVQKGNDNYYLLTKCSAVMIIAECGFLSNPEEEALLQDAEYQKRIVEALRLGICNYLESEKNTPENQEGTIYEGDDEISSENLSYKIPWYSTENVL